MWLIDGAQQDEIAEGSLGNEVKAGLVALQQSHAGRRGEMVEGAGEEVEPVAFGLRGQLVRDLVIQHASFNRPGAVEAPVSGAHFLDHAELDAIGGLEAANVLLHEKFEVFERFALEDNASSEETVLESVLGGTLFGAIGAGCFRFLLRGHRYRFKTSTEAVRVQGVGLGKLLFLMVDRNLAGAVTEKGD